MKTTKRCPSHPGRVLKELYLDELGVTVTELSARIGVSRKAVSAIVNGHKSVTPEMALRLSRALGTTPEIWLNLQMNHDLWIVARNVREKISCVAPISVKHAFA